MFRQTALPPTASDTQDHSMRLVEWAMALIAVITAGILALVR